MKFVGRQSYMSKWILKYYWLKLFGLTQSLTTQRCHIWYRQNLPPYWLSRQQVQNQGWISLKDIVQNRNMSVPEKCKYCRAHERGPHSDITFIVNGESFQAHRCILSARSEYFCDMLQTKWAERDVVTINHKMVRHDVSVLCYDVSMLQCYYFVTFFMTIMLPGER